jgi:hypothetical protein
MSEEYRYDSFDDRPPGYPDDYRRRDYYDDRPRGRSRPSAPLPPWLARRLLRPDEQVAWVGGPRFNPSWERYVTHPLLFVAALGVGALGVAVGALTSSYWSYSLPTAVLIALGLFFGSIIVLGLCCGYFTRLVATNHRLVILQGYEICRRWRLDDLPRRMVRRQRTADGEMEATLDLDAMKTMLGQSSDQFVDAKTILSFSKQINRLRNRKEGRF